MTLLLGVFSFSRPAIRQSQSPLVAHSLFAFLVVCVALLFSI